jgi:sortase A
MIFYKKMTVKFKKILSHKNLKLILLLFAVLLVGFIFWQLSIVRIAFNDGQTLNSSSLNLTLRKPKEDEKDFHLTIKKINLSNVPIILNVDGSNEALYLKALEEGVAHFAGTALPGQRGNVFIFGHSEYYPNKPGNYKTVFIHLDRLKIGEQIIIKSEKKEYRYNVISKKIISPKDTSVLAQSLDFRLTLMTCWPPGTTSKRLIIIAKLSS